MKVSSEGQSSPTPTKVPNPHLLPGNLGSIQNGTGKQSCMIPTVKVIFSFFATLWPKTYKATIPEARCSQMVNIPLLMFYLGMVRPTGQELTAKIVYYTHRSQRGSTHQDRGALLGKHKGQWLGRGRAGKGGQEPSFWLLQERAGEAGHPGLASLSNFSGLWGTRTIPSCLVPGHEVLRAQTVSPIRETVKSLDLTSCLRRWTDWPLARASKLSQDNI